MATKSLSSRYDINTGLLISASELKEKYLFGTPLINKNGVEMSDSTIEGFITSATNQLENYLNLLFKKQIYSETLQFTATDFMNWSYLRCTYPVVCPILIEGFLNTTKQCTYPREWLSSKVSSDKVLWHRNLYIVPAGNSTQITQAQLFTGIIPNLSYLGLATIPNYWTVTYVTGFDKIPEILVDIVAKLSAINVLQIISDLILMPGITSFSLGIDGLSQSLSSKGYDGRIKAYLDDLTRRLLPQAKDYYKGIIFGVA